MWRLLGILKVSEVRIRRFRLNVSDDIAIASDANVGDSHFRSSRQNKDAGICLQGEDLGTPFNQLLKRGVKAFFSKIAGAVNLMDFLKVSNNSFLSFPSYNIAHIVPLIRWPFRPLTYQYFTKKANEPI
jgi:hypothetical protein